MAATPDRGAECFAIDDPAARLACYDAALRRPVRPDAAAPAATALTPASPAAPLDTAPAAAAPAAGAVPAAVASAAAAPIPGEAGEFGLTERQRAARQPEPAEPPATALTAAVTAVRKLPAGYLRIDLDNAQQWQQTEIDPYLYLRVGEHVTIRKATLGSFLLQTSSNQSTRVRRVK
ncbi:MAG: hypothetical protein IT480_11165 [Gammaproteobacteria bacterium]|nr:hypothetical protein [Gammaproteobacteria bacterium]